METRAAHVIVGSFILLLLVGLVAFAIWIAKVDLDAEYGEYKITFTESVAGLVKRGPVLYQGVPVGEVIDIDLDRDNASHVEVIIDVRTDVPVTVDTVATLAFQGLTGVAFIELSGGSPGAAPLLAKEGELRPLIPSKVSAFAAIFQAAPELAGQAVITIEQLQKLFSDENINNIGSTIANIKTATDDAVLITRNVATASGQLDSVLTSVRNLLAQVEKTALAIENLASTGDAILQKEARAMLAEATLTMQSAKGLMTRLDSVVAANEPAITQFINKSLPEITRMIADLRRTARSLSRLATRIEKNPGEVIFGGEEEEYNLETRKKEGAKK